MTTKSRVLWTALAAGFVAAATLVSVSAQVGTGPGPGPGPGIGHGRGHGFGPGPLAILRHLNLTDAQRAQIRALTEDHRPGTGPMSKMPELQKELHAAIFADAPDLAKIEQLKTSIAETEAAGMAARIDMALKISQVLTAEQRQYARELPARGPGRHMRR